MSINFLITVLIQKKNVDFLLLNKTVEVLIL